MANSKTEKSGVIMDAEVICTFMEPDAPANGGRPGIDVLNKFSPKGWWRYSLLRCNWKQSILTAGPKLEQLGRIHEVESRLTDEQWGMYGALCFERYVTDEYSDVWRSMLHLSSKQKIAALAEVIRQTATSEVAKCSKCNGTGNVRYCFSGCDEDETGTMPCPDCKVSQ